MDEVLRGLEYCSCYVDDILVASESLQQHLRIVFDRLSKYDIVINIAKCTFSVERVEVIRLTNTPSHLQNRVQRRYDSLGNLTQSNIFVDFLVPSTSIEICTQRR